MALHANPIADLVHRNCRTYSSRVTVLGAPRNVTGFACQASDGTWQLVSEAPAALR
jgi:surface antigen